MKENFELMSEYNAYMNENIYAVASKLDMQALTKDRGAFFKSIMGTLNHILVGDIIWLKRIANHPMNLSSLHEMHQISKPNSLDEIIFPDLKSLQRERKKLDLIIHNFVNEISEEHINSTLIYTNTQGEAFSKKLSYILQHLFNHQTHHRGQVSVLLSQSGIDLGATDLLMVMPNV
ncbi:MAG: damage-inducible protein DinB [Pseudomonadales bacterium]|nr:damage-inducible protein DinB [Pseudomonadales bacterium]